VVQITVLFHQFINTFTKLSVSTRRSRWHNFEHNKYLKVFGIIQTYKLEYLYNTINFSLEKRTIERKIDLLQWSSS